MTDFPINEILGTIAIVTPIVVGLTEVIKRAADLPDRAAPAVALGFGIVLALLIVCALAYPAITPRVGLNGFVAGLISGLSASGLYSQVKTVAEASARRP